MNTRTHTPSRATPPEVARAMLTDFAGPITASKPSKAIFLATFTTTRVFAAILVTVVLPSVALAQATRPSATPAPMLHPSELRPEQFIRANRELNALTIVKSPVADADRPRLQAVPRMRLQPEASVPPPGPPQLTPPYSLQFDTFGLGHDPQVSVGQNYVAAIEAHSVAFYDKSGNPLPAKNNIPTSMSSYDLFQQFLAPKKSDDSPNMDNVNRFAGFPANPALPCDLSTDSRTLGYNTSCINEVFDLRVAYDSVRNRFIFAGLARNPMWVKAGCTGANGCYPPNDPRAILARRYTFFTVTRTEDPRDGFYQYWWADGSDWDRMAITDKYLVITYNGKADAHVFSADDIEKGSSYSGALDVPPQRFRSKHGIAPVVQHGSTGGATYFVAPKGSSLMVWAFLPPSQPGTRPPLMSASVPLNSSPRMIRGSAVFRSGRIHIALETDAACAPAPKPCAWRVRVLRVPVSVVGSSLKPSTKIVDGFLDYNFGHQGPGDDPSDIVSYELPSLEVNKNGDIIIDYLRKGITTKNTLYNEARYSALYHNEPTTRPSAVLHKGEAPIDDPAGEDRQGLDMAGIAVDPGDDETIWMTHAYAHQGSSYRMVVGAVRP